MAKVVQHGHGWRARWMDAHGKRQSQCFAQKADAALYQQKMESETAEIRHGWKTGAPIDRTVGQLCDVYLETQLATKRSPKDIVSIIERHIRPEFGHVQVRRVTPVEIDRFTAQRTKALSPKTVRNHLSLLQSLLAYAVECGWVERAPRVRKPMLTPDSYRYLRTKSEIDRFLTAARDEGEDVHMLYATAIYTGMRAGELAGLRWGHVDLDADRLITVRRSFDNPTKTGAIRHVPVYDVLHIDLANWKLSTGGAGGSLVFPNQVGKMHAPSSRIFQETLHSVLDRAGFADAESVNGRRKRYVTFHDLRHTFASHFILNGGDVFRLQRILGHRSIDMTNRYAHLAKDALEANLGRFGDTGDSRGLLKIAL